jgi:hypothetical protein
MAVASSSNVGAVMSDLTVGRITFSPGPWKADCFLVTSQDGKPVCHTGGTRYLGVTPQPNEAEANAQLIAAAPELLASAKAVLAQYGPPADYDEPVAQLWRDLQAAIAKAEGRS